MEDREGFEYTYSAPEQEEIRRIRDKYLPKPESRMEQLRRLDEGVTRKATMAAILVGVVGCLVMGLGMSMCMVWAGDLFLPGIVVGFIGMALIALALPVYHRALARERRRIAPEVLRLTEELERGER